MAAGERGKQLLVWIIVFTVLCTVFIGLRIWAAMVSRRRMFLDDYMIFFAYANTVALSGTAIWGVFNGLGKHTIELEQHEYAVQFKLILSSGVTWLLGTVFIKLSILSLYTRLFSIQSFKRWSYGVIAFVSCYGVAFLILFMSRCSPMSQQWAPVAWGWCRDIYVDQLASVGINLLSDVAIVVLPMPVLWKLQLPMRSKIAVMSMFSIGLVTMAIIAWRLEFSIRTRTDPDFVYNLMMVGLISLLELWLGIIVACIPTLAPLFQTYIKPQITKISHGSTQRSQIRLRNVTATVGSGGQRTRQDKQMYSQIEEETSFSKDSDDVQLVSDSQLTTQCRYDPESQLSTGPAGGIYVQRDIEARAS